MNLYMEGQPGSHSPLPLENSLLHTGTPVPPHLITTLNTWAQHELTPGWLDSLPGTVERLCARWQIDLDSIIPDTYVTLVLFGNSPELGPVVIKSSPLADEFRAEATALQLASSANVAQLYDVDFQRSAMVVERIMPGTQLRQVAMTDEDATRLAAETLATFWRPVSDPTGLHPLRSWMRALFDWSPQSDRIPPDLVEQAQDLAASLLARSSRASLLHGDLQHHNLLQRNSGAWVIIDPKGLIGDPGFDIAAWMYNPPNVLEGDDYPHLAERRISICADIWGIHEQELVAWAFVGAVLNACWSTSEAAPDGLLHHCIRVTHYLRTLLRQ
jgi:streptomycin 6-kinase